MKEINFSFIIPHKNSLGTLKRALDSIPDRDDSEIIIVDDDSEGDNLRFPHHRSLETKIILDKTGLGAGHARNIAIRASRGHWLIFLDADDFFTAEISHILKKYSHIRDKDIVFLNAKMVDERGVSREFISNKYIANFMEERFDALSVLRYGMFNVWCRMIRREIFENNGIEFECLKVCNDVMGILRASQLSNTFAVEKDIVYCYFKPSYGSQTDKRYRETFVERLHLLFRVNIFYSTVGYPYKWSIIWGFKHDLLRLMSEYKQLKNIYGYTIAGDLKNFTRYMFAKFRGVI